MSDNPAPVSKAWLGIGGNIGDVITNLQAAICNLNTSQSIAVTEVSAVYKTRPWGKTDQPDFFNACVTVETILSPHALLDVCLAQEKSLGRVRDERWGPRTVDIDILMFQDVTLNDDRLVLPHPRMLERAFVLVPLCDLAKDAVIEGKPLIEHLGAMDQDGIENVGNLLTLPGA